MYKKRSLSDFENRLHSLLTPAIEKLKTTPDGPNQFRKRRGLAGQVESAQDLCQAIKDGGFPEFPVPKGKQPSREELPPELQDLDESVNDVEKRLRNLVCEKLRALHGDAWYDMGVPGDSREPNSAKAAIEKRYREELAKAPYRRKEFEEDPCLKLEFSDIGHLKDMIVYSKNEPAFQDILELKEAKKQLERYFSDFIELRHTLKHIRKMDEVKEYKGRAAIAWIRKTFGLE